MHISLVNFVFFFSIDDVIGRFHESGEIHIRSRKMIYFAYLGKSEKKLFSSCNDHMIIIL